MQGFQQFQQPPVEFASIENQSKRKGEFHLCAAVHIGRDLWLLYHRPLREVPGYVLKCIDRIAAIDTLRAAGLQALELMTGLDAAMLAIVALSLQVSLSAVVLSCLIALPIGAATAVGRFPGRQTIIVVMNAFMGLPPVVVGLIVYLALSRAGPLGPMGLLFTPTAMVIAQALLVTPIIAALTRQIVADAWEEYREQLQSLGSNGFRSALTLIWDTRFSLLTAVLAGLGRATAEVGAVMIVGGNIDGVTRVMTTAIALETSKGDLALALALGAILILLVVVLNSSAYLISEAARRRYG